MTEPNLFAGNDNNQNDPNKNYLPELVGDGKKFKTVEELARGKYESDLFIETLKRQQDELRADYLKLRDEATAKGKLEDLIGQLENRSQQPQIPNNPPENNVNKPSFDPKEIESLFSKKIQEFENSKKEQENYNLVSNKLKESLGDNYQQILKTRINELGIGEDFANDLAKKHPQVLLRTLGIEGQAQQESFQAPPRSNATPNQFAPRGNEKRTWSYYQKMKAENPKLYYDPKTNVNMLNDMQTLGDAFKDGDYGRFKEPY